MIAEDDWTFVPPKRRRPKSPGVGAPNLTAPRRSAVPIFERRENVETSDIVEQRIACISRILRKNKVTSILDLGCGDLSNGFRHLKTVEQFTSLTGVDINPDDLRQGLLDALPKSGQTTKIRLFEGDLTRPCREWFPLSEAKSEETTDEAEAEQPAPTSKPALHTPPDAVTMIEVVEHLRKPVLLAMPKAIFGIIQPRIAILTTPNEEYNAVIRRVFGKLTHQDKFRHWDHKFEWTRQEYKEWCQKVVRDFPAYKLTELSSTAVIGETTTAEVKQLGRCSQVAVFTRKEDCPVVAVQGWREDVKRIF